VITISNPIFDRVSAINLCGVALVLAGIGLIYYMAHLGSSISDALQIGLVLITLGGTFLGINAAVTTARSATAARLLTSDQLERLLSVVEDLAYKPPCNPPVFVTPTTQSSQGVPPNPQPAPAPGTVRTK
jgi:hypothetical protein